MIHQLGLKRLMGTRCCAKSNEWKLGATCICSCCAKTLKLLNFKTHERLKILEFAHNKEDCVARRLG